MDSIIVRRQPNSLKQKKIHIDRIGGCRGVYVNGCEMIFTKIDIPVSTIKKVVGAKFCLRQSIGGSKKPCTLGAWSLKKS
jgi:hypothetical protein